MKKYIIILILFIAFGYLSYIYILPKVIFALIFLFSYIIISIRFAKPKEFRKYKLIFLMVPTILILLSSIFLFKQALLVFSLFGAYIIAVGVKNLLKKMFQTSI